ncbi:MAG: LysM peptidoglycan-binding domain-containing protein, partial [Candidatus Egerieousia sp.]
IHKNLHFEQISDNLGIKLDELRELNPQYTKDIIPASDKGYVLNLPFNYTVPFVEKEKEIYAYKDSVYFGNVVYNGGKSGSNSAPTEDKITIKVRKGQTLGGIASRYGVTVSQIKRWNNLRSNNIQIGKRLVIYKKGAPSYSGSSSTASTSVSSSKASSGGSAYKKYTIRKGDTLYMIAKRHNMSLNDLLSINGLSKKSKILPGKKIKVKA